MMKVANTTLTTSNPQSIELSFFARFFNSLSVLGVELYWKLVCLKHKSRPESMASLKALLQQFPYWASGHLQYAKWCFESARITIAYAGAQAVLQLAKDSALRQSAMLLLARCYIRNADTALAQAYLEKILETPTSPKLLSEAQEARADCFLLEGDYCQAFELLSQISPSLMSASARISLDYLVQREMEHSPAREDG